MHIFHGKSRIVNIRAGKSVEKMADSDSRLANMYNVYVCMYILAVG